MKNIFKSLIAIAAGLVFFSSCNLDLVPTTAKVYKKDAQLIADATQLTAYRNGVYANFRATQGGFYSILDEVMTDAFNAGSDFGNNYGHVHRTDVSFIDSDQDIETYWANHYTVIKNYNILIEALGKINDEALQPTAAVVEGETRFFRAFTYLRLARHFGKAYSATAESDPCVPLVLVYNQNELPERATVKAVYDAIKADLDIAAANLASVAGQAAFDGVSIDAVNALYARYYLDTKNYAKAVEYAEKVISSPAGYTLSNTAAKLKAQFTDDSGKEAIMQLFASLTETPNSMRIFSYVTKDSNTPEGYYFAPYFLPTAKLIGVYENADLRKACWYDNSTYPLHMNGANYYDKGYVFTKYIGNLDLTSQDFPTGLQAVKPFLLSEMYLIAAEASFLGNNAGAAKTYLNTLQTARKATATDGSLENIKKEWLRETIGEGLYFGCLKRWGEGFNGRAPQEGFAEAAVLMTGTAYEGKTFSDDDDHFQWPIPAYDVKLNENLVQNPGYSVLN